MNYAKRIWAARYFWTHLALSDLRSRWRRSFFGVLWCIIQPLGLTILLAVVFGKIFKADIGTYAPYILTGVIVWDFITATAMGGSLAFVQADAYIKQCQHPLAIYTLRTTLTNLIVFAISSVSLFGWVLWVLPKNISWSWLSALLIYPILILIAWPMATVLAYIATRFRDLPHALGLLFQAIWFVSPIYFEEKVFRNGELNFLVEYNPIYHLLEIIRAPLLRGTYPSAINFAYCLASICMLSCLGWAIGRRAEKRVIFYL